MRTSLVLALGLWAAFGSQGWEVSPVPDLSRHCATLWLCWLAIYLSCRGYMQVDHGHLNRNATSSDSKKQAVALAACTITADLVQDPTVTASILPLVTLILEIWATWEQWADSRSGLLTARLVEEQPASWSTSPIAKSLPTRWHLLKLTLSPICIGLLLSVHAPRNADQVGKAVASGSAYLLCFILLRHSSKGTNNYATTDLASVFLPLLEQTSLMALASLTASMLILPVSVVPGWDNLLDAIIRAIFWSALFILSSTGAQVPASTLRTIASSVFLCYSAINLAAFRALLAAGLATWQCIMSTQSPLRFRLLILLPLLASILFQGNIFAGFQESLGVPNSLNANSNNLHPIDATVSAVRKAFEDLQRRQSVHLDQAIKEYRRRYHIDPPPGFDAWFAFARQNDFVLIDEFDSLMDSLRPFRALSPAILQGICHDALEALPNHFIRYEIREHQLVTGGGNRSPWFADSMRFLLPEEWLRHLPNMTLVVNVYDEPKVVIPHDALVAMVQQTAGIFPDCEGQCDSIGATFLDLGRQDAWEATSLSCPLNSGPRITSCQAVSPPTEIVFLDNVTDSKGLCSHCNVHDNEGFLFTPETLLLTHAPVPVFSQAKPSTFNDILFPSPYYTTRARNEVVDTIAWEQKDSKLYWVGAATGGYATERTWKTMQRQRLALLTSNPSSPIQLLSEEPSSHRWAPRNSTIAEISDLLSIRIMGVTPQCETSTCEQEKAAFGIGDAEVRDEETEAHAHRFLLDVDGNSFSGRFHRLLRTNAVVFKQTLFKESHDDRLVPWVHFVPISTSFDELPEALRYLARTPDGQAIARRIAQESRDWAHRALREVDVQLVWFRTLLEYGRLGVV